MLLNKSRIFWLNFLFLVFLMLMGCASFASNQEQSTTDPTPLPQVVEPSVEVLPTSTNIVPSPTVLKEQTVIQITPVPLPTTLPGQAALLAQAGEEEENSVEFVIDTLELADGGVPWRFALGNNWYKYTSPGNEFSTLMLSGIQPEYISYSELEGSKNSQVNQVSSSFAAPLMTHLIIYYDVPESVIDEATAKEFLENYPFSETSEIISQNDIELEGYHGREFVRQLNVETESDTKFAARTRVYIIEGSVYELTVTGIDSEEVFGGNGDRFLNSFTVHNSSN